MNNSTEEVTLLTGFVFDILQEYRHIQAVCRPAFALAADLSPNKTDQWCSITIYNEICTWIEDNVGMASIRNAGRAIGERAFANIVEMGKLESPTPFAMMEALRWAASTMIDDPAERGWELLDAADRAIVMRRTQTFNCVLQEGLLQSLVEKTGVLMPSVAHVKCTRRGDEFCEYHVRWLTTRTGDVDRVA